MVTTFHVERGRPTWFSRGVLACLCTLKHGHEQEYRHEHEHGHGHEYGDEHSKQAASRQTSKQAGRRAGKQVSRQASRQAPPTGLSSFQPTLSGPCISLLLSSSNCFNDAGLSRSCTCAVSTIILTRLADTTMAQVLPLRDACISRACCSVYWGRALVISLTKRLLKLSHMWGAGNSSRC